MRSRCLLACLLAACGGPDPGSSDAGPPDAGSPDVTEVADAAPAGPADVLVFVDVDVDVDLPPDVGGDAAGTADAQGPADAEGTADAQGPADTDGYEHAIDAADAMDVAPAPGPWRSALYPEDWSHETIDEAGRFLHDFSYAGYHYGELPLPVVEPEDAETFDVTAEGADGSGESDATSAIQAAIDAAEAAGGGVVWFPPGLYRVDGALMVSASGIVLRGAGPTESRLWFTADQGPSYNAHLTFRGDLTPDLELPIVGEAPSRGLEVEVEDATGLATGDDVVIGWVITPGFIERHGMTGTWKAFNDTWQPFFWRTVLAVDVTASPHRVTLDVPLRYPVLASDLPSLRRIPAAGPLREVGVESLGLADAAGWEAAWAWDQVHCLELDGVIDSWVRDVATFPSPGAPAEGEGAGEHVQSGGLIVRRSKRVTVADTVIEKAQHQGGGGNGYLFEVRQSSEILFRDCVGREGRHNFIQNWGFGASGIVWLRVTTAGGVSMVSRLLPDGPVGNSEFHHSLATANLIDSCTVDDGWSAINRNDYSTGAGQCATECVFWNNHGAGILRSRQWGWGYVIGTPPGMKVLTSTSVDSGAGTEPADWTEGMGLGHLLEPPSLYEDQLARRLDSRPLARGAP